MVLVVRADLDTLTAALNDLNPQNLDEREDDTAARLARVPDLTKAYRTPPRPPASDPRRLRRPDPVDKAAGRIESSATISEQIAETLDDEKTLREEGLSSSLLE
jgi:hypothetical protein